MITISISILSLKPDPLKKCFQKKKREKRKQEIGGLWKWKAISPEGWPVQRSHYALAVSMRHYLSCLLIRLE
jgi:hypothetical protein